MLRYREMNKNPLHLLLDHDRLVLPDHVEKQVQELWKKAPEPRCDEEKYVIKETFEIEGREIYLMHPANFRHIYALLVNLDHLRQGLRPPVPGLHLSLANPIGKYKILDPSKGGLQTLSILGQDRNREQLTAIGGHIDKEDFTECTLPNGMKPIVSLQSNGTPDMKSIYSMCRAMDEAEQQMELVDCPATRCILREGKEEGGIDCYTLRPFEKCERYIDTPWGIYVIENWPIYNLFPKDRTTFDELAQTFHDHDRLLIQQQGERELSSLEPFSNSLPELFQLLNCASFAQRARRPSAEPVLRAEANLQARLAEQRLSNQNQPLFVPSSQRTSTLRYPRLEQVKKTLQRGLEEPPSTQPPLVKVDRLRN